MIIIKFSGLLINIALSEDNICEENTGIIRNFLFYKAHKLYGIILN